MFSNVTGTVPDDVWTIYISTEVCKGTAGKVEDPEPYISPPFNIDVDFVITTSSRISKPFPSIYTIPPF